MVKQQADTQTKTIRVLLTKYSDCISSFLYYVGGRGYTHASISLEEEDDNCYYSFNYKGFCVETIEKHRRRGVSKSMCYELTVSLAAYERIQKRLQFFKEHTESLEYTRLGLFFCLLHIPLCWKNHYFCSQFVADLLKSSMKSRSKNRLPCICPIISGWNWRKVRIWLRSDITLCRGFCSI